MADTYLTWWTSIEVDLRKSLVINAMRDHGAMHSLIRTAFEAGLFSATPPSPSTAPTGRRKILMTSGMIDVTPEAPSTAPEVDELNGGMHGSIFVKVWGDAGGGDAGREALAKYAFELGRRAALASRPAEVDDEGLPPLPKKRGTIYQGNYWTDCDEADPPGVPLADVYTAEQYRQGQRDAVAAYCVAKEFCDQNCLSYRREPGCSMGKLCVSEL